jgi:glycine oxidase
MMGNAKHVLIVGGGLAGSFMAMESAKAGHRITMVDLPNPKSATRVAAGLYNVVTGREANKTWMADEMLAALAAFTEHPDFASLGRFVHPMPIFRPFVDGKNYNDWMVRLQEPEFGWLALHHGTPFQPELFHNPIGGLKIVPCGWAETEALCNAMVEILTAKYPFVRVEAKFDYSSLDPSSGICTQVGLEGEYDEVIFAEGMGIGANPWFEFIEIRPLKGQILELKMEAGLDESQIWLRKMFLIPKGNLFYTAGSTYELHFEDDETTPEGIKTVMDSVEEVTPLGFEVLSARAAIRPTTPNRRPIVGRHPEFERLVVLNGLGTKGVLHAPFCAAMLRDWLDGRLATLPHEVSALRFLKKFA